jgi:hypothetical protein
MDHVWALIPELRRNRNLKNVPAISVTRIHKILPKLVGGKLHQIFIAIPKFDINRDIGLVFIPNPPLNLIAIGLLDVAYMVRKRGGSNAA